MATAEVFWTIHNIHAWRNCFRLVRFLPFENIQDFTTGKNQITDLHLIMALVKVNEGSRDVSFITFKVGDGLSWGWTQLGMTRAWDSLS